MNMKSKVVVVGAGIMGSGIAHAFAISGYPTVLVDNNAAQLAKANASIDQILSDGLRLGKITDSSATSARTSLSSTSDIAEAAAGARLVIETVSESLEIKKSVFAAAEAAVAPGAILASNTSALSVTEMAIATKTPDRFIGMHFFNPVHKMKLIELVRGLPTSDETVSEARAYADALGKTSIVVNESPGLTTSRMSAMQRSDVHASRRDRDRRRH